MNATEKKSKLEHRRLKRRTGNCKPKSMQKDWLHGRCRLRSKVMLLPHSLGSQKSARIP